jgi:cytochrome aa3-600 menaquinol oxidase subunit 4
MHGGDEEHELAIEPGFDFIKPHFEEPKFPMHQVWGYVASLILTFAALWLTINRVMSPSVLLGVVLAMAVAQGALQLGVFMHIKESRGPAWQLVPLGLAFAIGIGVVGMSAWIMLFKSGVS